MGTCRHICPSHLPGPCPGETCKHKSSIDKCARSSSISGMQITSETPFLLACLRQVVPWPNRNTQEWGYTPSKCSIWHNWTLPGNPEGKFGKPRAQALHGRDPSLLLKNTQVACGFCALLLQPAMAARGGQKRETGPAAVTQVAPSFHDSLRCDTGGLSAEFTVFKVDWIPSCGS